MSGPVAPNSKTINVEVNLLREWMDGRSRRQEASTRNLALLLVVVFAGVTAIPFLFLGASKGVSEVSIRAASVGKLNAALAIYRDDLSKSGSSLKSNTLVTSLRERAIVFRGQTFRVLNASTSNMVIEKFKAEASSGQVSIELQAQATDYSMARTFADIAGKGSNVESSVVSSSKGSSVVFPNGVIFDYVKKVKVGP